MKKSIFSLLALLAMAGNAFAQGPVFTVDDVTIENGQGTVTVKFQFDKDDYYGNFQMDFLFPDGVTAQLEGRNGLKMDATAMDGYSISGNVQTINDASGKDINNGKKVARVVASCNSGYALVGTAGTLFTFPVKVDESVVGAVACTLNNIIINVATIDSNDQDIADRGKEFRPEGATFNVVNGTTGIGAVCQPLTEDDAYRLNGQRAGKTGRGIIIQNGKKIAVK